MINLRILVPDDTINYIQNPAIRYATTGWNAFGSAITRSVEQARFNIASLKVVTNGVALREGTYYRVNGLSGISGPITVSAYVRGSGLVHIRLVDAGITEWKSPQVALVSDRWTRIEVTGACTGTNDVRLYVETDDRVQAITFYVDGGQMERKAYSTTYCDGDQPGCKWNVVSHGSNSSRLADTREGGRWVPLAGPCRYNDNIYVTVLGGAGMARVDNTFQSWASAPGAFFQDYKIGHRIITFSFFVKDVTIGNEVRLPSLAAIHELRQQLIDLFKPDLTMGSQAFLVEYSDTEGAKPLYIRLRYDGGLEGEWDIRNKWINSFPIRMLAVDPFWFEDSQDVSTLGIRNQNTYNSPSTCPCGWVRKDGEWQPITNAAGVPLNIGVYCFAEGIDGTIYIGGVFTTPAGITRIAKWDGATLTSLGGADAQINALAVGPDGIVYATGAFTTIGGVAANRVAKYNPATGAWSAMGTGFDGDGTSICVATNGQVYVGGNFDTAGGVTCHRIARWDGLQWRTVGSMSGFSNSVDALAKSRDGNTIYVGGQFLTSYGGGVTYNFVASINTSTNLISQMGYGLNNRVTAMAVGLDDTVYAGGDFTGSGTPGTGTLTRAAKYSGGKLWEAMGAGLDSRVSFMHTGLNGEIYAGGQFSYSGTRLIGTAAKWYGENWSPIGFPKWNTASDIVLAILQTGNGNLYIGGFIDPVVGYPRLTDVTNAGSATTWPIMCISGQMTLLYLANIKSNKEIFFNLTVFSGEDVFIDFARGKIWSAVRGDLSHTILPGSEIRAISLLPGRNSLSLYGTNDVDAAVRLVWTPQHFSADAVVDAENL